MMTCTECERPVTYDEETKLHHCGPCIRVGERVEWRVEGADGNHLTGTVTAYDLHAFDSARVLVKWDYLPPWVDDRSESRENLRHLNVLDLLAEI